MSRRDAEQYTHAAFIVQNGRPGPPDPLRATRHHLLRDRPFRT
ncbi:hypothetical protein [Actinoplanes aureus]|nr:hypothetical protein [Actinoplanes aureus]